MAARKLLGQALKELKIINEGMIQEALGVQREKGGQIGRILIDLGHLAPRTRDLLVAQLRAIGVEPGGVLLVHTAFRNVRPVENGPTGLCEALLEAVGPGGTLVMPSWTGDADAPWDPASTTSSMRVT